MKKATRRLALWRADLDGGVCAAPEECVEVLRDRESVALVLEHQAYGMTPATRTFETSLRQDIEWQFGDIVWPDEVRPGVFATVSWQANRPGEVVVRTTAMEEPIRVDGVDYFHEYDPRVVTREFDAGTSNRGQVLYAVRKHGRVFDDGSAVLPEDGLAVRTGLGRGTRGTFLLRNALDQLIREGYLTRVTGSLDASGYPAYPAVSGQKTADMLFYAPMVEPAPYPGEDEAAREYWVSGFVRKLPRGSQPSERQVALHEQVTETELEPGYTFVKKHRRG
jgi:hypothetical protein